MVDTTLLVMAAGMGSRFGGLKQITPIGPNGETILDFSIYDAIDAGFSEVVFIIKEEFHKDFENIIEKKWNDKIKIKYVYQSFDNLPNWYKLNEDRVKPFGTGHAVLCAKDVIKNPFAVINADDYYGSESFKLINNYLTNNKDSICMVGFKLENTLSENGSVSRGVCDLDNDILKSVTEHTKITKDSDISLDTVVSMNLWGMCPCCFEKLENDFYLFLKDNKDPLKGEFFLPSFVDKLIKQNNEIVKVLKTNEKWYGMTYKEDTKIVKNAIKKYIDEGKYNGI